MASRTRAWSSLAAVLLLLCITAVACLPAARALEASAAEASPAEASAELGDSAARQAARQAARASDRVFDRLRVRAEEQIGARVHERRTERRGTPGGDAGAANHPRATDPDPPNDHTVTPQEEVDGMITQLLDRASKVKLGPADAHSKDDETLPSDSAANTATAKTAAAKTTAAKTVAAKTVAEPVVTESSAMNENLRARLEAATTAAAEARLELAATKTQLEVATDAAAKARLAAKTDTDRDAALAEARDQRVVNERLRVELEAAKEAAAEARLAADEAAGAAAKLSVGRDSDAESGSDSGSRSGPASNARREVWVTVQVPVLETDDSKTSLSSRVVPALVDIARSGERGVATARASLAKARFVVVGGLLIPGSPTHRGKDPDAVACAAVAVDLALPAERVQCYGNGTDVAGTRRLVFTVADDASDSGELARVLALLDSSRDAEGAAGVFSRFAAAHRGAPPAVEFLKPHARLTFAIAVDASAANSVERSFRRSMFERMTSRASTVDLRDVTVRLARDAATTNAAVEAAAEHSANVLAALRRDSSRGGLGDARRFKFPHDVWFTVQVPTNSGAHKRDVREHLLPTLVDIASEGGEIPVHADDFALARSHFVLVGGVVVPGDLADPTIRATESLDVICGGLALDLGISTENIHCYTNGTVSYARDEDGGEYDSNPYGEEYADDGEALDDAPLSYEDSLVGPDSPPATTTSPPETAEESYEDSLARGVAEAEMEAPSEEDAYERRLAGGDFRDEETTGDGDVGSLGSGKDVGDWDPNEVHAWDETFTEDSLPDQGLNVSGTVVVFIVTGMHDQSDFTRVVSAVDLSQYSSDAEFKTAEALTGGRTPVLQFARHHARLTYAVSVRDPNLLDRVIANFRRPEAQLRLTTEMHGRSLIRDVKLKITPPEAYENGKHVDVQKTANATYAGLWTDEPLSAVAAMGADPSFRRRDVWATFQIPAAGDLHALRDTLFPAVANVTGSNLADVAFVDAHFVLIGALALPGVTSGSVNDDACAKALAADFGVDASFARCHSDDDVTVDVGNATRRAASLVYAISGMTSFPAFEAAVARAEVDSNANASSFPAVRALGGGAAPVAQFSRHHAFLTYAVETSNRDAADAMIRALESDAARDALAALVDAPRRACMIRNVAYKLPPFEEAAWPPPSAPPPSPPASIAPRGEMREVWFTVDVPPAAWREDDARLFAKLRPALMRVARSRGALPTLEDEHLVTARAAYAVVLEVELPRETMDLMGLEQLCAALAVDVGAHAADATCVVDAETAPALGAAYEKRAETRKTARKTKRREEAARKTKRREEAARRNAESDLATGLGVMGQAAARAPVGGVKIVASLTNVGAREDVLAVGAVVEGAASSETPGGLFSTTEALSGGVSPEMVHFDAREVITFAVKTWNQHTAQEVRLAMESPAAAEVLAEDIGDACEVHDVWIEQPTVGDDARFAGVGRSARRAAATEGSKEAPLATLGAGVGERVGAKAGALAAAAAAATAVAVVAVVGRRGRETMERDVAERVPLIRVE